MSCIATPSRREGRPPSDPTPAHHQAHHGGAAVGVDREVLVGPVAEDAGVHLHALHEGGYVLRRDAAHAYGVGVGAQHRVRYRLAGHRRHSLLLEGFERRELLLEGGLSGVVHDLVRVAHERVERVDVRAHLGREEPGREVVGPAVGRCARRQSS